jgi:hypothetical protein
MGAITAGSIVGAAAPDELVLLSARVIEGVGFLSVVLAIPSILARVVTRIALWRHRYSGTARTKDEDSGSIQKFDGPGLRSLLALTNFHSHTLTFRQPAQPSAFEGPHMDEYILPAAVLPYETKPLFGVVPFD